MKLEQNALYSMVLVAAGVFAHGASAGTFTTLYTFTGGADGATPVAGPTSSALGVLYGETEYGGAPCVDKFQNQTPSCGVTYRLNPSGTLQTLVTFNGYKTGEAGESSLARNGDVLYGSTFRGDSSDDGLVFSVLNDGHKFTALHRFRDDAGDAVGGEGPYENIVTDAAGDVFGITDAGGKGEFSDGVLFEIKPDGTYTKLQNFALRNAGLPVSLVIDSTGTLFGSTNGIAAGTCDAQTGGKGSTDCGKVFSYVPSTKTFTIIYSFKGFIDGSAPFIGGVNQAGTVFGAAAGFGTGKSGTLFELRKDATGYAYHLLYTFTGGADGAMPNQPFVDKFGNMTGTTMTGGANSVGTLYSLPKNGTFTTLYTFTSANNGGIYPQGAPTRDKAGNFYGTTQGNGTAPCYTPSHHEISSQGCGTIWKYTP